MKKLLFTFPLLVSLNTEATEFNVDEFLSKTYVTIGAGYKIDELTIYMKNSDDSEYKFNDPYSARIEIGYNFTKNVKFGISHHSQWSTGYPFNDKKEPNKTELFIDYTFTLNELF